MPALHDRQQHDVLSRLRACGQWWVRVCTRSGVALAISTAACAHPSDACGHAVIVQRSAMLPHALNTTASSQRRSGASVTVNRGTHKPTSRDVLQTDLGGGHCMNTAARQQPARQSWGSGVHDCYNKAHGMHTWQHKPAGTRLTLPHSHLLHR